MSYILDALKKADRERNLAKVPTLTTVHVPVLTTGRRVGVWAVCLDIPGGRRRVPLDDAPIASGGPGSGGGIPDGWRDHGAGARGRTAPPGGPGTGGRGDAEFFAGSGRAGATREICWRRKTACAADCRGEAACTTVRSTRAGPRGRPAHANTGGTGRRGATDATVTRATGARAQPGCRPAWCTGAPLPPTPRCCGRRWRR